MHLSLPIYWQSGKKLQLMGMNWFRNAHYFQQAAAKRDYFELITPKLNFEKFNKFTITYRLYYKNPNCDPSNIVAVIEKFLLDTLKHHKVIIDDNVQYHLASRWKVVEQDKSNPRIEITIEEHP